MAKTNRRDDWGTPGWLFRRLDDEFHFTLDACAEEHNAKCETYLTEARIPTWPGHPGAAFLNPPYAHDLLSEILQKATEEALARTVVAVLSVRAEMAWWHEWVVPAAAEIRFIRGRVAFVPPPGYEVPKAGNRPVFNSAVVVYRPEFLPYRPRLGTIVAPRNGKGETW